MSGKERVSESSSERSIVNPEDFVKYAAKARGVSVESLSLPSVGVMVFNSRALLELVREFNARCKPWLYKPEIRPVCTPYVSKIRGIDVVFILPGWGSPRAVAVAEEMIACGTRNIVVIGLCGSLAESVEIGSFVVPSEAIIDEGTSRHYIEGSKISRPDRLLFSAIVESCRKLEVPFHVGKLWTTDAIYRETASKIERFRKMGALCVDMETSAVFTLAKFRDVRAAALHIVSDSLSGLSWKPAFDSEAVESSRRKLKSVIERVVESLASTRAVL